MKSKRVISNRRYAFGILLDIVTIGTLLYIGFMVGIWEYTCTVRLMDGVPRKMTLNQIDNITIVNFTVIFNDTDCHYEQRCYQSRVCPLPNCNLSPEGIILC